MNLNNDAETKMKAVKAACDKAPAGEKKDAAYLHYSAAEKAHNSKDDKACLVELTAAEKALV